MVERRALVVRGEILSNLSINVTLTSSELGYEEEGG